MKLASSCFSTSSVTALLYSGANILHVCYTGLHSGLMLRWCCMIFPSIPSISSCFQSKTSWFSLKQETIFFLSRVGSVDPIFNTFDESPGMTLTSCGVSNGLEMGFGSLITHVWFSPDSKAAWCERSGKLGLSKKREIFVCFLGHSLFG